jgi:hypothetical protein
MLAALAGFLLTALLARLVLAALLLLAGLVLATLLRVIRLLLAVLRILFVCHWRVLR